MNSATFQDATPFELEWISEQLASGVKFVKKYAPEIAGQDLTLEALDAAWSAWIATDPSGSEDISSAINSVGIPFGAILVEGGVFSWCIATDDYGTDLAVRALPNRGDVLIYPADFVSKRWEERVTDFLVGAYPQIIQHVESLKAEWDEAKPL